MGKRGLQTSQHVDGRAHVLSGEKLLLAQLEEREGDLEDGLSFVVRSLCARF